MRTPLTDADIAAAAAALGVEACAVRAVVAVESSGRGFLPDGRPKILFEGHVFWRELQRRGIAPEPLSVAHPGIVYRKWDRSKYKGGAAEHARLAQAKALHVEAALCSASWGLFQIMGFNHRSCGFETVQAFVAAHEASEARQLEAFCAYLRAASLVAPLQRLDWAEFARRYNGPGYAANKYDTKLAAAYARCRSASSQ
ncbi:N-acetylmuramidase family protein [Megalodesulfovibrio paquesii]